MVSFKTNNENFSKKKHVLVCKQLAIGNLKFSPLHSKFQFVDYSE